MRVYVYNYIYVVKKPERQVAGCGIIQTGRTEDKANEKGYAMHLPAL